MPSQPPRKPPAEPPYGGPLPRKKIHAEMLFDDEPVLKGQLESHGTPALGQDEAGDEGATSPLHQIPAGLRASFSEAFLNVEQGPNVGTSVSIRQGAMYIGRSSNADLRIQHSSVSRRHAQLNRSGERFFLRDLASQNGTYVNKVRIKEVELFPDDIIVVGSAQLRLMAPSARTGIRSRPTAPPGRSSPRKSSSTGLVIGAASVGFVVAALMMFAWFKLPGGSSGEGSGAQEVKNPPAVVQAAPAEKPRSAEVAPATASPPEPKPQAVSPPPPAIEPEPKHPGKSTSRQSSTVVASRGGRRSASTRSELESSEEEEEPETSTGQDPTILARFEAGNLNAALELAKKKGARELLTRLTRFQGLYESGERALESHDDALALKRLDAALKLAEQLSGGWDKYSTDLRHQLSVLHLGAGTRLATSDPAGARKELSLALQYDPDNTKAQEQLAHLDPTATDPGKRAPEKKEAARSEIDAAFGN